ncbi:hypothetical protein [Lentzea kentuckyensis]|uniref:hypothetical protein n=1 Tax=Lentzea kentuckyensis TaxID=360086 RepID=UPI00146FB2F1|nr:hypothetical protein [Lentzea kentuckyensis]
MSTTGKRPDKHEPSTLSIAGEGVHLGNTIDEDTGTARTPLVMAISYRLQQDPSTMDWSAADRLVYMDLTPQRLSGLTLGFAVSAARTNPTATPCHR